MAQRILEFDPEALKEAEDAAAWYRGQSARSADAFLDEIAKALERIRLDPESGSPTRFKTRRMILQRFPFSVVYRLSEAKITVFAFAHHKRSPTYWLRRLRK